MSSKDDALTPEQLNRLEAAAEGPRENAYIRLMGRWGLRATEVAHVCPAWVSTQRGHLTIPGRCTCQRCRDDDSTAWTPKTSAGARSLPLHQHTETWEAVKRYLAREDDPWISRQAVWKLVKRVADRALLDTRVYPHALRATAATNFAAMGMNPYQLQHAMGWAQTRSAEPYIRVSGREVDAFLEDKDLDWV